MQQANFDLSGKRALVTGAGRGIGLACAERLAAHGAHVTLAARSKDEIEAAAKAIQADGGKAEALVCNTADVDFVERTLSDGEPWDILVNNAGTNKPQPVWDVDVATYDTVTNVNVRGAFFVAKTIAKKLLAADKPGSIIMMSSQMGHVGGPGRSVYCATKFAVEGMTKAMSADLAPKGIRVNSVCPTFIETPMTKPFLADEEFAASVKSKIQLGRYGQTDEIADAVLFLASDASRLMTGSAMMVDGGWTAA